MLFRSLPEKILPELSKAYEIWHLGDFCDLKTLGDCLALGRPFYAVLGNNDHGLDLPEKLMLDQNGRSFCLIHIPPHRVPACNFLLHGHTHVPRNERVGDCRILNPGSVGKANKGAPASWAWLEIGARAVRWKINLL